MCELFKQQLGFIEMSQLELNGRLLTNETAALRRLVALLLAQPQTGVQAEVIERVGVLPIATTFFVLDQGAAANVESFALHTLGRFLQHLQRRTEREQVELHGQVRGHLHWPATYKARYRRDVDPTRMVCRQVRHQFDTPENQLVAYVIQQLRTVVQQIPLFLREGVCYFPATSQRPSERTVVRLTNIEMALKRAQQSVYLRSVTLPRHITNDHLRCAETARQPEYQLVCDLYRQQQALRNVTADTLIRQLPKRLIPLPRQLDAQGEQWLQFCAELLRSS